MAFTTLPQGYVSLVFMITAGRFSWGPGGAKPPASHGRSPRLGVLSPRGERMWPRIRCPFSQDCVFMRGQTRIPVFFRSGLRATFFLHTKKEGKDVPRGNPLEPRVILIFRAIVGYHNSGEADTRTGHTIRWPKDLSRHKHMVYCAFGRGNRYFIASTKARAINAAPFSVGWTPSAASSSAGVRQHSAANSPSSGTNLQPNSRAKRRKTSILGSRSSRHSA